MIPSKTIRLALLCSAALLGIPALAGGILSGLDVGEPTPAIPVVDVTGAYAGKRVCYVCEFQNAPNVLAFFRDADDATAELIVRLDDLYRRHKAKDFKAVAILIAGPDAKPWLEELDRSYGIEIPLVVFGKGPQDVGMRLYKLDPQVRNTFLITVNRFVESNVADIEPSQFDEVTRAASDMLGKIDDR